MLELFKPKLLTSCWVSWAPRRWKRGTGVLVAPRVRQINIGLIFGIFIYYLVAFI